MKRLVIATVSGALLLMVSAAPAAQKRSPEETFAKMDSNGDGKLSMEEFQGRKSKNADAKKKRFSKMDANSDGAVSKEEFLAASTTDKNKKKK